MIRICTSHRTEALVDAFVATMTDERKRHGPFTPVRVVVPNRNVETYLRLRLAEQLGIAANVETAFLRRFLSSIAERATPGARVADAAHVEGHLLALLHDDRVLARPELADVRTYLAAADGDRDALDRRRCQLAAQLAQLFEEYASSRPELLEAWTRGTPGDVAHPAAVWQRALWAAVFAPGGRLAQQTIYQPLEALWAAAIAQQPAPLVGQTVHVFGLSYVAPAYHRMLSELGRAADVRIYTLSPCEDERGQLASSPDDPFGFASDDRLALRLWARPGRESLRMLAGLPGAMVDARFPRVAGDTVLRRLQRHIVEGSTATATTTDDSLRVLPCPSLRRELEVIAAEIWSLGRKDPTLRLCDVAVIVPEASKDLYLTQLGAVFGQSSALPHNTTDLPASAGHRVSQAIEYLLDLPFSSMSRKELLPLLTHPCVMGRFPEATPEMWSELADRLGIVRGADHADLHPEYPARDLFSWDQGLRRLTLGALGDGAAEAAPLVLGKEAYLAGPPVPDDDGARLGFGLLARSMIADARFAWKHDRPPVEPLGRWMTFVRGMVESYLFLDDDDTAGQAVVAEFLRRLDQLVDSGLGEQPVTYRVAAELARRELGGLPWSHGRYLSSGVTVSSFVPMRAIPFRAVFLLGLGQGAFPRPAGRSELDLRQPGRSAGDVDRREQDLYMFLETLLSARDQVVLSYVARDEVTGEELPASSVLLELRAVLGQGVLDERGQDEMFCIQKEKRPPLRRYDDTPERRQVLPAAEAEHRARALGHALRPTPYDPAPVSATLAALPTKTRTALSEVLGLPSLPQAAADPQTGPLVIQLSALRRFLEDPLQGSARFRLGLREDEDDGTSEVEDEPFDLANLERAILLSGTMTAALLDAQAVPTWEALRARFGRAALAAELAGRCPTGIFREAEARRQEDTLALWRQSMAERLGADHLQIAKLRLSPHADSGEPKLGHASVLRVSPRLQAPGERTVEVHVAGQTGLCLLRPDRTGASAAFTWRGKVGPTPGKEDLRAFLDYVVWTATGPDDARDGHQSDLYYRSNGGTDVRGFRFGRLERRRALDYLATLCRELLANRGLHPYLLPHEAVLASHANGTSVGQEIDSLLATSDRNGFSSTRGPMPDVLAHYTAPPPDEAERMKRLRFGLLFELLGGRA